MSTTTERENIEQVREILVGPTQRDLERKLQRAEAHLSTRLNEIQQETRRRTDVIEAHLRRELEALSGRLEGELVELREGLRAFTRDHRETSSGADQRVAKLEEAFARAQHETRSEILEQAKTFLDELQRTRSEFTDTLERELSSFESEAEEEPERRERELSESAAP